RAVQQRDRCHRSARGGAPRGRRAASRAERRASRAARPGRARFGAGGRLVTAPAVKIDRSKLPQPSATGRFTFPSIQKSVLPNGLGVWTVRHDTVPIVDCLLLVRRGSASNPPGQDGLAALTLDMLDEGSGGRSAIEMHEALARIGAQFDADIGSDAAAL